MSNFLRFSLISIFVTFVCTFTNDTETWIVERLLHGTVTNKGDFPFLAALFHGNDFFCGGTIISDRHVLTAAHCMRPKDSNIRLTHSDIVVRLGAYNISDSNEEDSVHINVTTIIVHPEWNSINDAYDADVAILVLSKKITYTSYIEPVDLPADDVHVDGATINVTGTVAGWGLADKTVHEAILKEATIPAINDSYCYRKKMNIVPLSSHRTFCAGFGTGVPNRGDSGGGFFVDNGNGTMVQYGVVSALNTNNVGKVDNESIAVYANVKSFKDWIVTTLNNTMEIEMEFNLNCDYGYLYNYVCWIRDLDIRNDSLEEASFTGSHDTGKTDVDVRIIKFENGTMLYLPSGIGMSFTKLMSLDVGQPRGKSLGLVGIKRSNLQNLKNLQKLNIYKNEIEIVDEDTLWDLPSLEIFQLINNQLKVLHERTFDENRQLREVSLKSNQLELLPRNLFQNNNVLERIDFSQNSLKIIEIDFTGFMFAKSFIFKKNDCINFQNTRGDSVELQRLITANCSKQ